MRIVKVHGISMEPVLHAGDIVLVDAADEYKLEIFWFLTMANKEY